MSAGISALAMMPLVATNTVFSARRASKGVDTFAENPVYGSMNLTIAGGQTLKGARAVESVASVAAKETANTVNTIGNVAKDIAKTSKFMSGFGKVIDFTSNHINPIICLTSGFNVMTSEDKWDTAARESIHLLTMFGFEGAANAIMGMPSIKKVNGVIKKEVTSGLYEKVPFIKNYVDDFVNYCNTTKIFNKYSLNCLPGILKGLAFVAASIGGYTLGQCISNAILGKPEEKSN